MKSPGPRQIRWRYKPVIHMFCLFPFAWMALGAFQGWLGVNPVEEMTHQTGLWALRLLLVTLVVTPLARMTRSGWIAGFRRMLGLYSFFYGFVHFSVYLLFDLSLDFGDLWEEVLDRPYITVGFAGFVILLFLAVTSPVSIRQKMGRYWNHLHRFVFVAGALTVVHYLWITKADDTQPFIYGGLLITLILVRIGLKRTKKHRRS